MTPEQTKKYEDSDSDTPRTTADAAKSCLVLTIVFVVMVFVVLGVLAWAMF